MNKVFILGHLGADPDLKALQNGPVCTFSVATSESWTDKNNQAQKRTEWHRVVVWGNLAEICGKYLAKGSQVMVEGKIQTRSWEDQQGVKKYQTEVVASQVTFLDSKKSDDNGELPL